MQVYLKHPGDKEEEIVIEGFSVFFRPFKNELLGEEILAKDYDLRSLAKTGKLVFTKLRLNC